ncbi:hypothetical protein [Rhizobium sp. MHM7A]|uniref:hypothetical protein n=1 Tax=Rhizobium sp. MHM7A TaxID=2583233 RepID=UPI00110628B5|nr:hypothetical protein [Rhizobium sp. MHM7A]TLX16048.1 hypothetical protein FFR93_01640 [Rhizobium sp. MHM7A]
MAEIIPFKKHVQNHETDEFGGLPDKWRLREFSHASAAKADKAVIALFCDVEDLHECRLFHVINPLGEMAASFAVLPSRKWVERTAFNSKINAGDTLQALAGLYRYNGWLTEFEWSRGYIFGEDGKSYSVNALPDAIEVYGSVSIKDKTGLFLPPMFSTMGNLEISNTTIARSPRYIRCFDLRVSGSSMYEIARRIAVIGTLEVADSAIKRLCHTAIINNDLKLTRLKRRIAMPEACTIAGNLTLEDVNLDIFDQNIVIGEIREHYSNGNSAYLGKDFLGQLLAPGSAVKFLNLIERDRHGYPINVQNTNGTYGTFVGRNDDGSYLCIIGSQQEPRQFVDVCRLDVIGVRKPPALPTL